MNRFGCVYIEPRLGRREAGKEIARLAALTAMFGSAALAGCGTKPQPGSIAQRVVDKEQKRAERIAKEKAHPFNVHPQSWLEKNAVALRRSFDVSGAPVHTVEEGCVDYGICMRSADGVRFIRTPGSGILRNRTLFVQRVLKCIEPYQAAGKHIRYVADGHVDCGAGRVFAEDHGGGLDTDMVAKHELEERIAVLKEMGVDASFGVMLPLQASDREVMEYVARSVILDCTGGRFQDYRSSGMAHSFVVSSDDPQEAAQGVSTVMDIMQGRKGYNGELEAVNAVVFQDPERGKHSQTMLDGVVEIAKARADMEVRVIPHMAPRAA